MPNKSWKIRDIVIDNQVVIAPMAGISNSCFRVILQAVWSWTYLYRNGK